MNREQMIDELLKEVEDWDLDTLIDWIQLEMLYKLKDMTDDEVENRFNFNRGLEP